MTMALFFGVLLWACAAVCGFNVDIPSREIYKGNFGSMFGFAVQAHMDGDRKMILVGAPEDEPYRIDGVTRPGAVYRCRPGHRSACEVMDFDKNKTNNVDTQHRQIDQKSHQWFGATLSSNSQNGAIVACAPRYVSYVTHNQGQRDPVGSCYLATSSNVDHVTEFSPCRTSTSGQRKTGQCQAGFSAGISKDGQRLFLGAPGSWYWQGRTFSIDSTERFFYYMPKIPEEGQLYSQDINRAPSLIATREADQKYDDSYMGYSITVGDFAGRGVQGVAVGVPRGSELRGLVVLYTWELHNIKNISGSQIGAYFGYSLASGDIDGDGADDVIVGAPMFCDTKKDGYEHGRVYVIYQGQDRTFSEVHRRTGEVSRGRFGLSVTSLGDINYDGFGDIAVGAPYAGENGRGVVYIYYGSELGIKKEYSQAITAEDIAPTLTTFGFSLSGGVDLDNNKYTDLVVGAYKSDSVVFLKSRPVVNVTAEVEFMEESKLISLTEKRCRLTNGTKVGCAQIRFCLTYDGVNVAQEIYFEVTLDLDSRQTTNKRLFLMESRNTTYTTHILLTQRTLKCMKINVYLDDDIRDKLTPIEVKMTYDLVNQPVSNTVPPVLDQTKSIARTDSLNIQKNCGPDNICVPNLRMAATTPIINYVLGSGENVNIDVKVENSGEDAFEASYYLQIPAGVTYTKMERLDKDNAESSPIYCSIKDRTIDGNSTLKCDLGNPMSSGQKVNFRVILEVDSGVKSINFDMEANSTNPEQDTQYDNVMHMPIAVVVRAQLSVIGTSDPPELHYNASLYSVHDLKDDTKLGPQLIHKYNIKNEGPFAVEEAEIYIMWPYQTLDGDNLMYMLVQPQTEGEMKCDVARHINPEELFVQNPYASLLTKEREAMLSSDYYSSSQTSGGSGRYGHTYWEEKHLSGGQITSRMGGGHSDEEHIGNRHFNAQNSQVGGGQFTRNQYGSGQYNGNQNGQFSSNHYEGHQNQFSTSQHNGIQYYNSQHGSAQHGGITSRPHGHNKTWSAATYGRGFTAEEEDAIRKELAVAASRPNYGSNIGQGSYSQGSYGQGTYHQENHGQRGYSQGGSQRNYGQHEQGFDGYGVGQGGQVVRIKNKTILYDENHNIISQSESSTEYGSLGHEGEAGSSFHS